MLIATIAMFSSASMSLALDIFSDMVVIRGALIDQSLLNLDSRQMEVTDILSSVGPTVISTINAVINVRSPLVPKV